MMRVEKSNVFLCVCQNGCPGSTSPAKLSDIANTSAFSYIDKRSHTKPVAIAFKLIPRKIFCLIFYKIYKY